jgi:Na+/melibiose symporter-like transporter
MKNNRFGNKKLNFWQILGLSFASAPFFAVIGVVVIRLMAWLLEFLETDITKLQETGYWWVILIIAFILVLIYLLYEPSYRRNQERKKERKKLIDALYLYWEEQLVKHNKTQLANLDTEQMKYVLSMRFSVWVIYDSECWTHCFPNEKRPEFPFEIVDEMIENSNFCEFSKK